MAIRNRRNDARQQKEVAVSGTKIEQRETATKKRVGLWRGASVTMAIERWRHEGGGGGGHDDARFEYVARWHHPVLLCATGLARHVTHTRAHTHTHTHIHTQEREREREKERASLGNGWG